MLHIMCINPNKPQEDDYPLALSILSMTDFSLNKYTFREDAFTKAEFSHLPGDKLHITTPVSSMTGDRDALQVTAILPNDSGRLELTMSQKDRPVLFNCGTGYFPILGSQGRTGQFSLPYLKARGILQLHDKEISVSGSGWLDREWADVPPAYYERKFKWKWKWMNLQLDNGCRISLWDVALHEKEENSWATVLFPSGAHLVTEIRPLAQGESEFYRGKTGQIYPTSYHIEIPAIRSWFDVRVKGPLDQEIISSMGEDKYEAACTFTGYFLGKNVKGTNYVELVGSFR